MEMANNGLCSTFLPRCLLMLSKLQIVNMLMIAQRILSRFRIQKKYQINSLTFRISVSNEPEMEVDWEVVLEDSFEKECADVSNEIINVQLDSLVNEKRYIKFEILSFGGNGGCIQYFDVDRKPRVEKTSIML